MLIYQNSKVGWNWARKEVNQNERELISNQSCRTMNFEGGGEWLRVVENGGTSNRLLVHKLGSESGSGASEQIDERTSEMVIRGLPKYS